MRLSRRYILLLFLLPSLQAEEFDVRDIPLQDEGRIKPLDTFARNHLLAFYGKRSIKEMNLSATDWILNLILDPQNGKEQKIFNIRNPEVVSSIYLDWSTEHKYSFNEILPGLSNQAVLINMINQQPNANRTVFEKQLLELNNNALRFEEISYLKAMKLLPPDEISKTDEWSSPLEFIVNGRSPEPHQDAILNALQQYLAGRLEGQEASMKSAMANYKAALLMVPGELFDITVLKKETWMNRVNLFYTSVGLYLFAFILLGLSWMIQPLLLKRASYALLILGFLFHAYGIYLRMHIMGRPPVSTLYESVIFVAFIVILFAIILEYFRRDGLGIFVGTVSGSIFHYIGFGYSADGDTLGMLVAVLNSNFWLATHVTTITMGYGASLVAGFIGHLYLVQAIRQPENKSNLKSIFNNLFGITLIALFFTLFGTILGGIWADQSWGRFWGWDPKENGALLIVLWQLMMVHMRLSGLAKPAEFALGMALNNIIVALAWFGVNLLQVGLHSYGFDDGVARNLFIFIVLELIIGFGTYLWPGVKKKHQFV
ncbi:MAG: cytochrome c biogenesis protein CcsA [Candidatus Marinimicrobia bacterium]|nr:cytochrome c biogenesis protein CcsA [Candidatus Neomarinimicrobiota bacterium]MEC7737205.1 cytochrome c biogenesis protein CcsA [Candidatus Neomarinimicrobiota bacterium]